MEGLQEDHSQTGTDAPAAPSGAPGVILSGDPGEFARLGFKEHNLN